MKIIHPEKIEALESKTTSTNTLMIQNQNSIKTHTPLAAIRLNNKDSKEVQPKRENKFLVKTFTHR